MIELLIVIVLLGILATIFIPNFVSKSKNTEETVLKTNLKLMRKVLELYRAEHDGKYPNVLIALVRYSSFAGAISRQKTAIYKFGPYMSQIPPCPVGSHKGTTGWGATGENPQTSEAGSTTVGWLYNSQIRCGFQP